VDAVEEAELDIVLPPPDEAADRNLLENHPDRTLRQDHVSVTGVKASNTADEVGLARASARCNGAAERLVPLRRA
jgi:hypothetical protein